MQLCYLKQNLNFVHLNPVFDVSVWAFIFLCNFPSIFFNSHPLFQIEHEEVEVAAELEAPAAPEEAYAVEEEEVEHSPEPAVEEMQPQSPPKQQTKVKINNFVWYLKKRLKVWKWLVAF